MDNNKTMPTPEAEAVVIPKKPSALKRAWASLDGMHHMWLAFLLPVIIMALIYVAMEVWPFGTNSVLVLDLNGQYVYYFEAIRDILHGEQGILYSFERALGGEFLGIVAYYLASPFSIIVALFPEGMITEALYFMFLLKCGLSGMNMCVYLHKSHPTNAASEVIFSVLYALTSYAVVMQHNTMWIDCLLFFPLIMLGIESLIKYGRYKLFVLTLAVAVFSNYYIGYMVCIGVAAYFFFYYFMCTPEERNPLGEKYHFLKTFGRMGLFSAIAVGMASIIILPAYYSLQFGKSTFSNPKYDFAQKFDFLDLISKMFPASYDTVRPEGLPFVYSGTLTLILLVVFFFVKNISPRKKVAYGALMGFFVFSFNASTIDLIWHGFQRPNWLNYRYSFMFSFVIIVMAYLAFEHITSIDISKVLGVGAVLGLVLVILQKLEYENMDDLMCVWFSMGFIAAYMILLAGCNKRWLDGSMSAILCVFVLLELFCNGLAEVVSLDSDVRYSSRPSYTTFMEKWTPAADYVNSIDDGFFRAEKTKHRKTNDNFAININGLSNSTSTLNRKQIDLLQYMGYSSKSHWSKYLGGTPLSDSLLGVKYLLAETETELGALWGEPIWTDELNGTAVYENKYALSLGYMANTAVNELELDKMFTPFERMNKMVTAMLGEEDLVELFKPYKHVEPTLNNVTASYASGHKKYVPKNTEYSSNLEFEFTAVNDYEIFVYFPSDYKRDATLFLNGDEFSEYFTNETCRIISIGSRETGEEISIKLQLDKSDLYITTGEDYFYYLDEELFAEIMPRLMEGNYNIESFTDDHIVGTVTVPSDKTTMVLTIPYDEGWKVYVDGELTPTYETLHALTAVDLLEGEHTVEMRYAPKLVTAGVWICAVSATAFVGIVGAEHLLRRRRRG